MKLRLIAAALAAVALWAQAPQGGGGAAKGKGKAADGGKGKAKAAEVKAPTPPPIPQVLRLVRSNTYLVTGHGTNSVFRVTPQGVILVDTKLPDPGDYERLAELIRGVTPQPVKYIFNTSAKPEASGNNARFVGAEVVTGAKTVKLGGTEARSEQVADKLVVFFPDEKLAVLGAVAKTDAAVQALGWTLAVPETGEPVYR